MAVAETITLDVIFNGKKAQMGLKELGKRLNGIQKTAKKTTNAFSKLMKFAGFAGFTKMAIDAAHFGRSMGLLADKTGIATEKLSSMRNAFSAIGGDAKAVDRLLGNITSGLARLSMGEGEFAAKLSAMGISAWDSMGNTKTADVVMGDLADWTKSQLAMGRSMAEVSTFLHDNFGIEQDLVNELALGRAGMEKARRERERRTGRLEGEELNNLKRLNIAWSELKTTLGITADKIIADLSPALQNFNGILEKTLKWVQENPLFAEVMVGLTAFSTALSALPALFTAISSHPLVALALGAMTAGYAIGGGFSKPDTMEEAINKDKRLTLAQKTALKRKLGLTKADTLFKEQPKLTTKDLISGRNVYLDGTPYIEEPEYFYEDDILNGNEVVLADGSDLTPVVSLNVTTEANFNEATGQIEQNVDVNGQSESGSGSQPVNYFYQSLRNVKR